MKRALLALAALALFPSPAHAAFPAPSLTVDPAFAPLSGIARDDFAPSPGSDLPAGVVVANGDVYTVGSSTVNGTENVAIVARRADGTFDPGFDGDGKLLIPPAAGSEHHEAFWAVALPNGHLRIAAQYDVDPGTSQNYDVEILGLLPNGQPDPDLGGGSGRVVFPVRSADDVPTRMEIDANGRIAITGSTSASNLKDTFVSLRNPDGSPAAFGTNGVVTLARSPGGLDDFGADVAFRPGGGLAVLTDVKTPSASADGSDESAVIDAFTNDGSPDLGFGAGGEALLPIGDPDTSPKGMIEHHGRLFVTGKTATGVDTDAFIASVDATNGAGFQSRHFDMRGKDGGTDPITSNGSDLAVLAGPPETLVVAGNSITSSSSTGQFAAAAFNNFDADLAAASYGDYVFSGSDQIALFALAPEGPYSALVTGYLINLSSIESSFGTARLLLDADKKCDAAVDVPSPLELNFVGRRATAATITVTNKGQKSCPAAAVGLAAPYKLGRGVATPVLAPGETFTAANVPITTPTLRRDDDVAKFAVSIPGDGDTSNDVRGVRVVFSFCDLALNAVQKPSTLPSEGVRRVEVGLSNKGTTTCRRVQMKVTGGTGAGASKPYSIERGRAVSDDVNVGVKRGTKVGRKVTLRVRALSFDEDVVSANDSIRLTSRVVGVGDTRVSHTGASAISGTATGGRAPTKKDARGVKLARVQVAVRRLGKACRWLSGKRAHFRTRKLAKGAACSPTGWQSAAGTRSWRLALRRALPPGRYKVLSRAVTKNGFREARFAASDRNLVNLHVR